MEEPGRFRDARMVRIGQRDRTGGAALPVAHEKGRDLRLRCEFFRLVCSLPESEIRAVLVVVANILREQAF
jgi:hypothetical protein